jgi:RHS repeat-associated protein
MIASSVRQNYQYDKSYAYGWLDKVMSVSDNGKLASSYDYGVDGQLASRTDAAGKSENFTWDGLALVKRDSTNFVNESAITGGNPILAFGKDSSKALFEDMLGSTVGSTEGGKFNAINRTSFGESNSDNELNFFTGKPQVEGLGYAFLFRNYRADQGKWQTSDPIGYPDGWNNLAYVNNKVKTNVDPLGLTDTVSFSYTPVVNFNESTTGSGLKTISVSLASTPTYSDFAISLPPDNPPVIEYWWVNKLISFTLTFSSYRNNTIVDIQTYFFSLQWDYNNEAWVETVYTTGSSSISVSQSQNSDSLLITGSWSMSYTIFSGTSPERPTIGYYYAANGDPHTGSVRHEYKE